ncbi:lysis protein [Salmonella enterica subsp. enterica]|nr:lysis protein [Salmonella enterica subsp. enterica]
MGNRPLPVTRYGSAAADTATHNLNRANETISDAQTRQRDVAALDARYTKELADAQTVNADLQRRLAAGGRCASKDVVQRQPAPKPPAPAAWAMPPPSNSPCAGQNVLDIRAVGSSATKEKLKYLQEYIRRSANKKFPAGGKTNWPAGCHIKSTKCLMRYTDICRIPWY